MTARMPVKCLHMLLERHECFMLWNIQRVNIQGTVIMAVLNIYIENRSILCVP